MSQPQLELLPAHDRQSDRKTKADPLGHSTLEMVLRYYALDDDASRKSMDSLSFGDGGEDEQGQNKDNEKGGPQQ